MAPCCGGVRGESSMRIGMVALIAAGLWAGAAAAQVETNVVFPSPPNGPPALQIPAVLRLPAGATGRVPAVIVVHSSGGTEDTNPGYVAALNAAGIATLVVDYFAPRGVATLTRPGTAPRPNGPEALPDSVGALAF